MQPVVVVGENEFAKAESVFTSAADLRCLPAPDSERDLAQTIRRTGARAAVVGTRTYRRDLYAALPKGGVIARFGVGHDGIDKAEATRLGLLCTNTPGVMDPSVAELAMLMILAAARRFRPLTDAMLHGRWEPSMGIELRDATLAVIGCGRIGSALAAMAAQGFQMQVRCASRRDDFADAVAGADFVSLHIPATPENLGFLDRDRLARLEPHAWLVNTSRGSVVDESALYEALAAGRIGGAALDVFAEEPYVPLDPARDLRRLQNVILTPHVGSSTAAACQRIARRALENIRMAETGDHRNMDLVNPEVLST